jgi:hypothetical protein
MKDGDAKIVQYLKVGRKVINGWAIGSYFGDRAFYHGDWVLRAVSRHAVAISPAVVIANAQR